MKNMQRILISVLFASFTQNALAEKSGWFLGFDIGYGGVAYHQREGEDCPQGGCVGTLYEEELKRNRGGVNYGFVAGYKQFFTPHIGLRYYINVGNTHFSLGEFKYKYDSAVIESNTSVELAGGNINYGVNVDFLGNFIANEKIDFGGFLGVGLGGNYWWGNSVGTSSLPINSLEKYSQTVLGCYSCTHLSGFDVWLNVGLRTNIAQKHGVELVCRVPFLQTNIYSGDSHKAGDTAGAAPRHWSEGNIQQIYSIAARYIYNF